MPWSVIWVLHQTPPWFHRAEVLWNHFVEIAVPFGVFGPRAVRTVAGVLLVVFQVTLILSGNLSFLNWLTIVVCLSCFDDRTLGRILPRLADRARALHARVRPTVASWAVTGVLTALVLLLSIDPVGNLISDEQIMNTAFDRLHLVNTYGAFGTVGRVRREIVIEGSSDAVVGERTRWRSYDLHCKPGNVWRRPSVVAPYHLQADLRAFLRDHGW